VFPELTQKENCLQPKPHDMNPIPNRVVIYPKDVSNITGLRQRAAGKLLAVIRQKLGKHPSAFVTVKEFAAHTGISEEMLTAFLV
jgi:hypothetical protein